MMKSLELGRTQRQGNLPGGCNPIAISSNPEVLLYAALVGDRATRRKATRNLRKVLGTNEKAAFGDTAFSKNKGNKQT